MLILCKYMVNTVLIRISQEDAKLLKDECKEEFLNHHPEMEDINLTYLKLVHETVKFYLKG